LPDTSTKAGWPLHFNPPFLASHLPGRFFWKDFLIAACQLPLSFNKAGFVPSFIGWKIHASSALDPKSNLDLARANRNSHGWV
jgi:hypothetical protein